MSGNGSETPAAGAGEVIELPGGYVKGKATDINQIVKRGFEMSRERLEESGATDGSNTAQTLNEIGVHTENLTEEEKRRQSLQGAMNEQLAAMGKSGGPADSTIETHTAPLTSTVEAATAAHVPAPAASEVKAAVNEKPPTEDWEAILEDDKGQKFIETQQAWIDLMDAMEAGKETAIPYFVKLGIKGESSATEQRNLILIQPFKDQNGNSEKYLMITKDGPRAINATPESKNLINRRLLGKEDASMSGELEKLESASLAIDEGSDPITSVISQSKETAKKITEKSGEMKTLDISKALAEKIKSSLTYQTPSGMSNS